MNDDFWMEEDLSLRDVQNFRRTFRWTYRVDVTHRYGGTFEVSDEFVEAVADWRDILRAQAEGHARARFKEENAAKRH